MENQQSLRGEVQTPGGVASAKEAGLRTTKKNRSADMEMLLSAKEAAELLHCSARLLKAYAKRRQIPAMKMGNRWMFLPSLLEEWRRKKLMRNCQ